MKVRQAGRIVSVAVIVAVGVNTDGRREVLGMDIGPSEAVSVSVTGPVVGKAGSRRCDRIVILQNGTVAVADSPHEAMIPDILSRAFQVNVECLTDSRNRTVIVPLSSRRPENSASIGWNGSSEIC